MRIVDRAYEFVRATSRQRPENAHMRGEELRRLFTRNKMTAMAAVLASVSAGQAADYFLTLQNIQQQPDHTVTMSAAPLQKSVRSGQSETIALTVQNSGGPIAHFGIDLYPVGGRRFSATHRALRASGGCTLDTSLPDADRLDCGVMPSGRETFHITATIKSRGSFRAVPDGHPATERAILVEATGTTSGQAVELTDAALR